MTHTIAGAAALLLAAPLALAACARNEPPGDPLAANTDPTVDHGRTASQNGWEEHQRRAFREKTRVGLAALEKPLYRLQTEARMLGGVAELTYGSLADRLLAERVRIEKEIDGNPATDWFAHKNRVDDALRKLTSDTDRAVARFEEDRTWLAHSGATSL